VSLPPGISIGWPFLRKKGGGGGTVLGAGRQGNRMNGHMESPFLVPIGMIKELTLWPRKKGAALGSSEKRTERRRKRPGGGIKETKVR